LPFTFEVEIMHTSMPLVQLSRVPTTATAAGPFRHGDVQTPADVARFSHQRSLLSANVTAALAPLASLIGVCRFIGASRVSKRRRAFVCANSFSRPRADPDDPDAINAFDMEVMGIEAEKPKFVSRVQRPRVDETGDAVSAADFQDHAASNWAYSGGSKEEKKPVDVDPKDLAPELDEEMVKSLVEMTDVERADLIDELTRKAFVLMEAGEMEEATKQLKQVTRIGGAFQRLNELQGYVKPKRRKTDDEYLRMRSESEVLAQLKRDLENQDYAKIFGNGARYSTILGMW